MQHRPVDLAAPKLPLGGGVTTLVIGAIHLILAAFVLVAGILSGEAEMIAGGGGYAGVVAVLCVLAGLTLRGSRGCAIAAGVMLAIGAGFFALGSIGVAISEDRQDADTLAFAIVVTVTFLVPAVLMFRDARRIRRSRSATIANLQEAFQ